MQKTLRIDFDDIFRLSGPSFSPIYSAGGDFWRIYLDYCNNTQHRELAVFSSRQQPPQVLRGEYSITCIYPSLIAEDDSRHDIRLELTVTCAGGALHYSATMQNNSGVRLNELQYPLFSFSKITGDLAADVLYLPEGLGHRIADPHRETQMAHTEYMAADDVNILQMYQYPGQLSMPWMALQSGESCLYLGVHSDEWRKFSLITATEPRQQRDECFMMGAASYPAVYPGETLCYDGFTVALFDADWRSAAGFYRAWAEKTWLVIHPKKDSIRKLNGWQRVILKSQYGEIYHTYDDLPAIFREGVKRGIHMILLFAWWQEGMDNGYPNYQPDDALGGAAKLKAAIRQINDEGGVVVLYANGHLIDMSTEYYRAEGHKYTMKDIEGKDYREHYMFSNSGTLLKMGHKTFVTGCYGTREWPEKILEIEQRHLDLGSNGTFFDQLGCAFYLCFDQTHSHGRRIDLDPQLRLNTITQMRTLLQGEEWFGTEWVVDRISPHMDFTHGFGFSIAYQEDAYPYIFRYTFPEIITSNRLLHDDKPGFEKHLNYAFVHGLVFDVATYRCRGTLADVPEYARYLKTLTGLRDQYKNFFMDGKFDLPRQALPPKVWGAEYSLNGETILTVWNDSNADYVLPYGRDQGCTVRPGEVKVLHV